MDADPEQCVEGTAHVSPPVPTEHEFVEVALQVALSEAVEFEGEQIRPVDGFARERPSPSASGWRTPDAPNAGSRARVRR